MKKYRIKKEAVPFIKENHVTSIYPFDTWDNLGIDINALEEVKDAHISYGFKKDDSSTLSGWNEKGSQFHFTIHFPSVKFNEHDEFSKGKIIRELMDAIQHNLNDFYNSFSNNNKSK